MKALPCPFCGVEPELFPQSAREGSGWGAVACANLACPAKPRVEDGLVEQPGFGVKDYQAAAIERWNTRWTPGEPAAPEPPGKELQDMDPMPWGKFKGKPMQDVPASYFFWLWTAKGLEREAGSPAANPVSRPVAEYIHRNLDALEKEHPDGEWRAKR